MHTDRKEDVVLANQKSQRDFADREVGMEVAVVEREALDCRTQMAADHFVVDFEIAEDEDLCCLGLAYNIVRVPAELVGLAAENRRYSHTETDSADHMLVVLVVTLMLLVGTHSLVAL